MNRKTISQIATVSLLLGTATVACTPGQQGHVASMSEAPARPKSAIEAQRLADAAKAAMTRHKSKDAIEAAEKAVALAGSNADYRMLLGQTYLSGGRFASAETAFRDALSLSPALPRASFNLALAETAQGKGQSAQAVLSTLKGKVPDADLGLAYALSGDRAQGIDMLTDIVRAGKSDARTRQNLALAFALDGRWREARGVAMQDTPPQRINDQIAEWADLARPGQAGRQIAAMLGTTPAATDPGQPVRLALASPTTDSPVALALAAPEAKPAATQGFDAAAVRRVSLTLDAPVAAAPVAVPPMLATPAPMPAAAPIEVAAADPAPVAAPAEAAMPVVVAPPPLIRASRKPARVVAPKSVAPGPELMAVRQGGFVVQLGAFSHANAIEAAWARASKLSPNVATFTPVKGSTQLSGATLIRLSVGGFKTHADASALCNRLKGQGQACFVRGVGNDAPLQWVRKDTGKAIQTAAILPVEKMRV